MPVPKDEFQSPSKECDMVMKGGITSGVIYPPAVCELAKDHRLRHIGGASAGAIAAAAAAAAEHDRAGGGYTRLKDVSNDAGEILSDLFQPTKQTRPPMKVLLAALSGGGVVRKTLSTLLALVVWRPVHFLVGLLVAGGLLLLPGLAAVGLPLEGDEVLRILRGWALPAFLIALPVALLAAAFGHGSILLRKLPENNFGICNGEYERGQARPDPDRVDGKTKQPLTPWLHYQIQRLAGRTIKETPLTFGDLWGASSKTEFAAAVRKNERATPEMLEERAIDLQMVTTNLTEGMPYRLPFETRTFTFCTECFSMLFPPKVVAHMVTHAGGRDPANFDEDGNYPGDDPGLPGAGDDGTAECRRHAGRVPLLHLPLAHDLPILISTRMSLSFPVLLSAVPLYKRDFGRAPGKYNWTINWFSDGGIGSNFPVHFFDSLWPKRPTFAIDLQPVHPDFAKQDFFLRPQDTPNPQPRTHPIASITSFLGRVFTTMQNWNDSSFGTLKGYSSRILTIHQRDGEGGMNLKMEEGTVKRLARRGGEAAKKFNNFDFDYHRWLRYRIATRELDVLLSGLLDRYDATDLGGGVSGYREFLDTHDPESHSPEKASWQTDDRACTDKLMEAADEMIRKDHPAREDAPSPSPILRLESRQVESS